MHGVYRTAGGVNASDDKDTASTLSVNQSISVGVCGASAPDFDSERQDLASLLRSHHDSGFKDYWDPPWLQVRWVDFGSTEAR